MKFEVKTINNRTVLLSEILAHSVYPPPDKGYWKFLIPPNFTPKNALLLGLGGGTVCKLLIEKYPDIQILAVDNCPEVVEMAIGQFGLNTENIQIVVEDAFEYVYIIDSMFNLIIVDLFTEEEFSYRTLSYAFLKRCEALLSPGGKLVINTIDALKMIKKSLKPIKIDRKSGNILYTYTKET